MMDPTISENVGNGLDVIYNNKKKTTKLFSSASIRLTMVHKRIPPSGKNIIVALPHSLKRPGDRILLITKDEDKKDYEKTASHYRHLLKNSKTPCPAVTVMPLRELTVSYMTFESRRKLRSSFDLFLSDKRICHRLPNKLGSQFSIRHIPVPVNLEAKDLGAEVNAALSRIRFAIAARGSNESAVVAHVDMGREKAQENIEAVVDKVVGAWPGGKDNVRMMQLTGPAGPTVPIYLSETEFEGEFEETKKKDTFKDDLAALKAMS